MRILFLSFFIALFSLPAVSQKKFALLVGIGDYDKSTNWNKLNSVKDIEVVKQTLERQRFDPANIRTVINQQATKQGIVAAMKQLITDVGENSKDVVYIHVSSHGAQIEDEPNGDETDGLDEAIVTINAKWTEDPAEFKKVQGDYLRDDEFGDLIEQLRKKLGKDGDVVVVLDLCHSGTATRGELVARGNKAPIVSAGFHSNSANADNLKEFREGKASRGDNSNLATYVVFSAARAEEAAYETYNDNNQKMGALTYAFCKSLENLKDSTSYRSLFAKVEAIMDLKSNIQHPVLEGSGVDRGFLGGQFVVQKPYVEVESIDADNKKVKIKAGMFGGIDVGSVVSFYPSGTTDPAKAKLIAKGKVSSASQFTADITLESGINNQPKEVWAFVTEPVFKIKPIVISINEEKRKVFATRVAFSTQESMAIRERLKPLKQVSFNGENADLILVKGETYDSIIIANNGFLFATTQKKSLEEILKIYSKYKFLKELEVKDNSINVEIKLGKLRDGKVEFPTLSKTVKGYEYNVGETMIVAVKNISPEDVFVNILDFQPDGIVNPLFPNKSLKRPILPSELKVPAGKEIVFKDYQIKIGPPLGSEVLKIFVSDQEIDMEGVAREFKARSFMSAMESLVADAPEVITRGGDVLNLREAKGVVFNLPFQIKAK